MLNFAKKRGGKNVPRALLEAEADKWLKALSARVEEARKVGLDFKATAGTATKAVK